MHLDSWTFVFFVVTILGVAVLLLLSGRAGDAAPDGMRCRGRRVAVRGLAADRRDARQCGRELRAVRADGMPRQSDGYWLITRL